MPAAGGGMFGVTPQEVYQQQQQGINQSARDIAGMDGFTAAKYAMGQVGGGLARPVAGMLGLKNTEMENAQQEQDIQSQIDHSTPDGLMKGAQLFNQVGNPRMAMMYQQAAQAMIAQNAELEKQNAQANYYTAKANAPAKVTAPPTRSYKQGDNEVTEEMQPDGTWKVIGTAPRYKGSTAATPVSKGTWVDAERAGLKGQENTVTGEFKPYAGQTSGTRGTEAQRYKQKQQMGKDKIALKSLDTELENLKTQAAALKVHTGLKGVTGVQGKFPSIPGGEAAQAEVLLEEFKAATKNAGLQLVRQGGSIGAMTEKEWPIVEAMVSNIDPKGGLKQVQAQIDKVIAKMEQVKNNTQANFDELYSEMPDESAPPEVTTQAQYDALPSGAMYTEDGKQYRKP